MITTEYMHVDAHGILLYTENNYFYFSMHSSSLYSIFTNWLYEHPRIHEYYTSSIRCHSTSWLEPVSLTLRTSPRLRQIKLNDSSRHKYCHVTSRTWSHALHEDVSVYTTWYGQIHQAKFMEPKPQGRSRDPHTSRSCIQTLHPTQQANTIHLGHWRCYMFSLALVHSQLISSELRLET